MDQQQDIIKNLSYFIENNLPSEEDYNELALRIFSYQYQNILPYQAFCRQKGKTPRLVKTWRDIPFVPINAFKEVALSCTDPEAAEAVFMTSGTTKGIRGKHYHPTLQIYDRSMIVNFKQRFMKETEKIRMGVLFPTKRELPNSSLAHYLALGVQEFGTEDSCYLLNENGLDMEKVLSELE